jgi:hypothetical protein
MLSPDVAFDHSIQVIGVPSAFFDITKLPEVGVVPSAFVLNIADAKF